MGTSPVARAMGKQECLRDPLAQGANLQRGETLEARLGPLVLDDDERTSKLIEHERHLGGRAVRYARTASSVRASGLQRKREEVREFRANGISQLFISKSTYVYFCVFRFVTSRQDGQLVVRSSGKCGRRRSPPV